MPENKPEKTADKGHILAVDTGLRTGLALFGPDSRLMWYRSSNFGSPARLKQGVHSLLKELPEGTTVVIEGGGPLGDIWQREAGRRKFRAISVSAERWRGLLLLPRQQRTGPEAKRHAGSIARSVIEWSGLKRPTSLRHDAAEAILVGLWAAIVLGWIEKLPDEVGKTRGLSPP